MGDEEQASPVFNPEDLEVVDLDKLTFEEMMALSDAEIDKLTYHFDLYKADRAKFQKGAFLIMPKKPPLVLDCIHYLRLNSGLKTEGIFRVNGDAQSVDLIRENFINNIDMNDILLSVQQEVKLKNYDVATALKSYFRLLEDPLVPFATYEKMKMAVDGANDKPAQIRLLKEQVKAMPSTNRDVFCYIMLFFQDVVDNQDVNKMTANNLATCLTMSITRFVENKDAGQMAAMMEVGISTKIISILLTEIDFTEFITPKTYYNLLKATSYKKEELPRKYDVFKKSELFDRFKARYGGRKNNFLPALPPLPGQRRNNKLNV